MNAPAPWDPGWTVGSEEHRSQGALLSGVGHGGAARAPSVAPLDGLAGGLSSAASEDPVVDTKGLNWALELGVLFSPMNPESNCNR